jgi:cobalt-zinc-cadmium resistance protein CzcA
VDSTIETVKKNLFEGRTLVIVILFLLLGNFRAALSPPASSRFRCCSPSPAWSGENQRQLDEPRCSRLRHHRRWRGHHRGKLHPRLAEEQHRHGRLLTKAERFEIVFSATREVRKASIFGELIIMVVYLPILTLTGIEGKMFFPMAFTVLAALGAAMILSVTFVPAAVAIFLGGRISEKENILIRTAKAVYEPMLRAAIAARGAVAAAAVILVMLCLLLASRMGSEFIPRSG